MKRTLTPSAVRSHGFMISLLQISMPQTTVIHGDYRIASH